MIKVPVTYEAFFPIRVSVTEVVNVAIYQLTATTSRQRQRKITRTVII